MLVLPNLPGWRSRSEGPGSAWGGGLIEGFHLLLERDLSEGQNGGEEVGRPRRKSTRFQAPREEAKRRRRKTQKNHVRERERNDRAGTNQRELQRVEEAGTRAKERAGLTHEREEMEVETRLGPLL